MRALLVIDIQEEYMNKYPSGLLCRINERIAQAHTNDELIVYIKNARHLRSGTTAYDLAKDLLVCSSYIFIKEKASVFSILPLSTLLQENSISEIEIIGIDGCCCVASSASDAASNGYHVTVPCDYVGVQNLKRFERKKTALTKQGVAVIKSSAAEAGLEYAQ